MPQPRRIRRSRETKASGRIRIPPGRGSIARAFVTLSKSLCGPEERRERRGCFAQFENWPVVPLRDAAKPVGRVRGYGGGAGGGRVCGIRGYGIAEGGEHRHVG